MEVSKRCSPASLELAAGGLAGAFSSARPTAPKHVPTTSSAATPGTCALPNDQRLWAGRWTAPADSSRSPAQGASNCYSGRSRSDGPPGALDYKLASPAIQLGGELPEPQPVRLLVGGNRPYFSTSVQRTPQLLARSQ